MLLGREEENVEWLLVVYRALRAVERTTFAVADGPRCTRSEGFVCLTEELRTVAGQRDTQVATVGAGVGHLHRLREEDGVLLVHGLLDVDWGVVDAVVVRGPKQGDDE